MKTISSLLIVGAALAPVSVAAQTMYKCVQDGKVAYQDAPCPTIAQQALIKSWGATRPPAAVAVAAVAGTGAEAPLNPEVNRIIECMSIFRACADSVKIWGEEMAEPYQAWSSRNVAIVSRVENNKQLQAIYQQRVETKRNGKADMCRPVALELRALSRPGRRESDTAPGDPR
jgi:hypothetical protein